LTEVGLPVPCLTLLFFGAAKDVREAAKMVTAGTAPLYVCTSKVNAERWRSGYATSPEQVQHQRNQSYDQQKMNQPAGNVERQKSHQPHYKQNDKQCEIHRNPPYIV